MKPLFTLLFLSIATVGLAQTRDAPIRPDLSEIDQISIEEPKIADKNIHNTETLPFFPGGPDAFRSYLAKNITYPKAARRKNKQGTIGIQFIIEKDGSLSAFKVARSVDSDLDREALRVIRNSPKWNPAIQNGLPARVLYTVPVKFSLN
jgi:TonB family protein